MAPAETMPPCTPQRSRSTAIPRRSGPRSRQPCGVIRLLTPLISGRGLQSSPVDTTLRFGFRETGAIAHNTHQIVAVARGKF
jgi:hypothetical protein